MHALDLNRTVAGAADFAGNLLVCRDVNTCIPHDRWDLELPSLSVGGPAQRFAAFMPAVDRFDEGLFRLAQAEAVAMDPQCRVLLEHTYASMQVCLWATCCCNLLLEA